MNYYEMLLARKLAKGELPPNAYLLKEASGSLVSFSDGADLPMPSFICKIEAVQSGSGDPSPENIRPISGHTGVDAWLRGKNLFNPDTQGIINARCTATDNDGIITITASGADCYIGQMASEGSSYSASLGAKQYVKPNTTYYLKVSDSRFNKNFISFFNKEGVCLSSAPITDSSTLTTPSNCCFVTLRCGYELSTSGNVFTITIQLEEGNQATPYEPYNGNTYSLTFTDGSNPLTVYGGKVDLVSGELTVTHKSQTDFTRGSQDSSNKLYNIGTISDIKAYTNASVISPYFIDSMFEKLSVQGARAAETPSITHYNKALYVGGYIGKEAELDTLLESLQVKYELETPITYQLTPQQIKSLLGNNNAWCDTGDVDIEYFGKGDA